MLRLQPGFDLVERRTVFDRFRKRRLPLSDEEWNLVHDIEARSGLPADGLDSRSSESAASLGHGIITSSRWPNRFRIPNDLTMPLRFVWHTAIALRLPIGIALTTAAALTWLLRIPAPFILGVLVLLVMVTWSVASHELAHLAALRLVLADPEVGGLWRKGGGIAVIRPSLDGRRLRIVAAAGPLGGGLAVLPMILFEGALPGTTAGLVVSLVFNLMHLLPPTGDGSALWSGSDGFGVAS